MKEFFKSKDPLLLNKKVHLKLEIFPHTFVTWVEDMDKENIYVAGIANKELNGVLPLPGQKIKVYMFSEGSVYQFDSFFKKKIEEPVYLWGLSKLGRQKKFFERRLTYRVENTLEMDFNISRDFVKSEMPALTKNISVGGLAFATALNLDLETQIQTTLPVIEKAVFPAKIVWKYQKPYFDKWYYGVKFLEIAQYQESLLAKYINTRLRDRRWAGLD